MRWCRRGAVYAVAQLANSDRRIRIGKSIEMLACDVKADESDTDVDFDPMDLAVAAIPKERASLGLAGITRLHAMPYRPSTSK